MGVKIAMWLRKESEGEKERELRVFFLGFCSVKKRDRGKEREEARVFPSSFPA